jgi:hypothetical protein
MIHMGVRDKNVTDPAELTRHQGVDVTEIKEDGAATETKSEVKAGIAERTVDEMRLNQ